MRKAACPTYALPFGAIKWAREHRVARNMPRAEAGDDSRHRYRYAELKVRDDIADEISRHVAEERQRQGPERNWWGIRSRSKSPHYPVQTVAGSIVRIEWNVLPKLQAFLAEIGSFVKIGPPLGSDVDFRRIEAMSKADQEQHVLELIETGDRINAVKVVKLLYKMDTTEAVKFIEGMSKERS